MAITPAEKKKKENQNGIWQMGDKMGLNTVGTHNAPPRSMGIQIPQLPFIAMKSRESGQIQEGVEEVKSKAVRKAGMTKDELAT